MTPAPSSVIGPEGAVQAAWWVDGHLDLAYVHQMGPGIDKPVPDPQTRGVSLSALLEGRVGVVLGTIFTESSAAPKEPWSYAGSTDVEGAHSAGLKQLNIYLDLERQGKLRVIRQRGCLEEAARAHLPGVVILMECADPIRSPDEAAWWHAQGVRVVGIAWSHGSRYAGGNSSGGPLTAQGRELVRQFDRLGVLHDASHLSDEAFDGLCAATRERIVFTHSNARALLDTNQRHATDAQLGIIAQRDGMVGLNLYGRFLATGREATLQDALRHVEHVATIAGRHCTGVGSDFDGGFTPAQCAQGCQRPQELGALLEGLRERGWTERERNGFAHANWMRVLRSVLS